MTLANLDQIGTLILKQCCMGKILCTLTVMTCNIHVSKQLYIAGKTAYKHLTQNLIWSYLTTPEMMPYSTTAVRLKCNRPWINTTPYCRPCRHIDLRGVNLGWCLSYSVHTMPSSGTHVPSVTPEMPDHGVSYGRLNGCAHSPWRSSGSSVPQTYKYRQTGGGQRGHCPRGMRLTHLNLYGNLSDQTSPLNGDVASTQASLFVGSEVENELTFLMFERERRRERERERERDSLYFGPRG